MLIYIGKVLERFVVVNATAYINSFQFVTKTKIAVVAKPDFKSGNKIFQNIVNPEHPSIFADSSSSFGICLKYPDNIHIAIGKENTVYGIINEISVSLKPTSLKIRYKGLNVAMEGNIEIAKNRNKAA